ncbi:Zinc finger, C2H2 domain and Zinc finger, C2H2-like domain-containing protein [Aphelenchoides besseyi]|nr:Zinc finger, C2H2 domain and Zinc finger, C2H2-like domain-containing protein [Aphelenchoides besseyi]KAI6201667.1 Zinc finger, C2H2 domain and Zinc finger, C2H2-like domain-containing protein [Aphelenchoides besseyi]
MSSQWLCFTCNLQFEDSSKYRIHLEEQHTNWSQIELLNENEIKIYCEMCRAEFSSIRDHEIKHYSTKTVGGLIECTNCYRAFKTLEQMKAHQSKVHLNRAKRSEVCCLCERVFNSRNVRDQHLITHFPKLCSLTMQRVDETTADYNQCSICAMHMSTRKSLRTHLLLQHVFRNERDFDLMVGKQIHHLSQLEFSAAKRFIQNPDLLWKKETKKTRSDAKPQIKTKKQNWIKTEMVDEIKVEIENVY